MDVRADRSQHAGDMSEIEIQRKNAPLILVIDGETVQRVLARDVLHRTGFAVEVAASGIEGLEKIRSLKPDLVMLGVRLPDLNGVGVCRACQEDDGTRNIPILIVAEASDSESIQRGFEAGARDFLTMPVNWSLLDQRIRFILRESQAARRLSDALQRAEAASQGKNWFLANLSHELRTPLNAIIGFAEMLNIKKDNVFAPKDRKYAGHIRRSGEHLLSLINDVLDLAKIDASGLELNEAVVSPASVIADCIDFITPQAQQGELTIETELPASLPALLVDARRLRQVLLNLLSNAVKFTPKGGHVKVSAGLDSGGRFTLRVADSGIGMSAEEIEIVQQPFRRVENDFTRTHDGTGLGLPLASALARAHGGEIVLESAPNAGTTAILTLPPERVITARVTAGTGPAAA